MWSASKILHVSWLLMASCYYFKTYQDLTCTWDEDHYFSFFVLSIQSSPNLVISTNTFILLTFSGSEFRKGSAGWSLCGVRHWWKPGGFPGGSDGKNPLAMRETWFDPWVGKIPWRRAWQPTPVFLPGESHGQRGLVGYSPTHGVTKNRTRLSD